MNTAKFAQFSRPRFTELEQKLLRLALNAGAEPGEIRNASLKLVESLRRRGLRPEALIEGAEVQSDSGIEQARCMRMPFGKHRGKGLDQIPVAYLRWVLSKCSNLSVALREAIYIVLGGAS